MYKKVIFIVLSCFIVVVSCSNQSRTIDDATEAINKDDISTAINILTPLGENGDAKAQQMLGEIYQSGMGGNKDLAAARRWHQAAAEQGVASAQYNLGVMHYYGLGGQLNYTEAEKWYRKASEQGMAEAQFNLGVLYDRGRGLQQNYELALKWYEKAADQGYLQAMHNMAVIFEHGKGVCPDFEKAKHWYSKSAGLGFNQSIAVMQEIEANGGRPRFLPFTEEENADGSKWVWLLYCSAGENIYEYIPTSEFPGSPYFRLIPDSNPQVGDIAWWPKYMAIYDPDSHVEAGLPSDRNLIVKVGLVSLNEYEKMYGPVKWYRYYKPD